MCAGRVDFAWLEEGQGPLLLLLHGFPDSAHTWDGVRPRLASLGYRVVSPNLPGYAPTERPANYRYSTVEVAKDLLALGLALSDGPFVLVAQDWGCEVAYAMCTLFPEHIERFVAISLPHRAAYELSLEVAWTARHSPYFKFWPWAAARVRRDDFAYLDELVQRWSPEEDKDLDPMEAIKNMMACPGVVEATLEYYKNLQLFTPRVFKTPIPVKTLLLGGESDRCVPQRFYFKADAGFSGSYRVQLVPGGHFMQWEHEDELVEAVTAFLAEPPEPSVEERAAADRARTEQALARVAAGEGEPPAHHIPGSWAGGLSLQPVKQAFEFVMSTDDYTKEHRAAAGSAVFKAHPGVRSTFITDMAGLDFVFSAPPELLDRIQDGHPGFGCLGLNNTELLDGVVPALVARGEEHAKARALVVRCLQARLDAFEPSCLDLLHHGPPMLRGRKPGDAVSFNDALNQGVLALCFRWLFGLDASPEGADVVAWLHGCFGMRSDESLSNFLASKLGRLKYGPKAATKLLSQEILSQIRQASTHPVFEAIAEELSIPGEDVAAHLLFLTTFNATGGTVTTAFPALAQLSVDKEARRWLQGELDDFDGDLSDLDRLPNLHDFMLESMRLFGRPRQYYRRAMQDLRVPVSVGAPVFVPAGTTLVLVATLARQDRTVWGEDAAIFDPYRFGRRPELRERVHSFGPPTSAPNQFGCVGGELGVAAVLWKALVGGMARRRDWKLEPWPEPDVDALAGVVPDELEWIRT